jgi:hypothetical protein
MQTITSIWGTTFRGVGVRVDKLPDGTYQGVTEDGYRSAPYADAKDAIADATAHIAAQGGK